MYMPIGLAIGWILGDLVLGYKPITLYILLGLLVIQMGILIVAEMRKR